MREVFDVADLRMCECWTPEGLFARQRARPDVRHPACPRRRVLGRAAAMSSAATMLATRSSLDGSYRARRASFWRASVLLLCARVSSRTRAISFGLRGSARGSSRPRSSRCAAMSDATTGVPSPSASTSGKENPSSRDGRMTASACLMSRARLPWSSSCTKSKSSTSPPLARTKSSSAARMSASRVATTTKSIRSRRAHDERMNAATPVTTFLCGNELPTSTQYGRSGRSIVAASASASVMPGRAPEMVTRIAGSRLGGSSARELSESANT